MTLIDHGTVDHPAGKAHKICLVELNGTLLEKSIDGGGHGRNVKVMTLELGGKVSMVKRDPCKQSLP